MDAYENGQPVEFPGGNDAPNVERDHGLPRADALQVYMDHQAKVSELEEQKKAEAAQAAAAKAAADAAKSAKTIQEAFEKGLLNKSQRDKFRARKRAFKYHAKQKGMSEAEANEAADAWEMALIQKEFANGVPTATTAPAQPWKGKTIQPTIDPTANAKGEFWLQGAGKQVHPLTTNQYSQAAQAKSNIAAEIASRMNNKEDWELFRQHMANRTDGGYSGAGMPPAWENTTSVERMGLLSQEASARVQNWAGTSGDTDRAAVLMQMAVKDEFGTTGHPAPTMAESQYNDWRKSYYKYPTGDFYRMFARHMYNHTQDEFKKAGITHVSLYRGMNFAYHGLPSWVKMDKTGKPELQPINSWSTKHSTAIAFSGTGNKSVMMEANVPVELILGSARTGFGCLNEQEFVVFDAPGQVKFKKASYSW
jgi:hypothetical protein